MRIASMRLIPNDFNGGEDEQCLWENKTGASNVVATAEFMKEIENQYGPWPSELICHMVDLHECLAEAFKAADKEGVPGAYRGEHVEMCGDENYSIEIVFVD